jgi:hypothetical protein
MMTTKTIQHNSAFSFIENHPAVLPNEAILLLTTRTGSFGWTTFPTRLQELWNSSISQSRHDLLPFASLGDKHLEQGLGTESAELT